MSANDKQIGGTHYAEGGEVQHWDWVVQNHIGYLEAVASKYVARYRKKNGKQDLEKALHYVQKLMESSEAGLVVAPGFHGDRNLPTQIFANRNGLTLVEQFICKLLATWAGRGNLVQVKGLIENLIDQQA